jgi:hypothetical protein
MGLNNLLRRRGSDRHGDRACRQQSGANTGDYVSLKNYERCTIVVIKAAGVAGDDPVITDDAGAGRGRHRRQGAELHPRRLQGRRSDGHRHVHHNTQAAGNTYTDLVSAEAQGIFAVEFKGEDLDVNNGFDCLKVSIPIPALPAPSC